MSWKVLLRVTTGLSSSRARRTCRGAKRPYTSSIPSGGRSPYRRHGLFSRSCRVSPSSICGVHLSRFISLAKGGLQIMIMGNFSLSMSFDDRSLVPVTVTGELGHLERLEVDPLALSAAGVPCSRL